MKYDSPDVTVVIPCYKVGKYLAHTLESVLAQTHSALQIVAVDDCSPDETGEVIRKYAKMDSRLQGIYQSKNAGVSMARNAGIDIARAPWIAFVDGDDWLPPNAIERLLQLQASTGASLTCCNARQYDEAGTLGGIHFHRQAGLHELTLTEHLTEFWPHQEVLCTCWAKLFSTQTIREHSLRFRAELRHAQDTLFTLTYALKTRPRIAIDYGSEVYCYRQNPASCVHAIPLQKRLESLEILISELDDLAIATGHPRRLAASKAAEYLWAIKKFSDNSTEKKRQVQALCESPLYRKHIEPVLARYGKWKHRLLLRLFNAGWAGAIRWW